MTDRCYPHAFIKTTSIKFSTVYILYLMSRYHSYINSSTNLIASYKGEQPFAIFIKNFFSQEKKYGSSDRRQIAALCYNYFRLGFAIKNASAEERIIIATFLCEQKPSTFLGHIQPEWNKLIHLPLNDKLILVKDTFSLTQIFPFKNVLSETISLETYCQAMLMQPFLFLRIRPQCRVTTLKKLKKSQLPHQLLKGNCIELPTATNIADFFIVDKEVVVQDYNSQQVLDYLRLHEPSLFPSTQQTPVLAVWDCCAASGGKSILLHDTLKAKISLTVSDIRLNIMLNLHQRFKRANIKEYAYFIEDSSDIHTKPPAAQYQLIICDAPCTGSGTWGRTPEQVCFFKEAAIKQYSERQKRIVENVSLQLMPGGVFVYITCSVFKEENEAIANFIQHNLGLNLLNQQLLKGFDKRADTMFVAIFKK